MTDHERNRYVRIMTEVDELEDRIEEFENAIAAGGGQEKKKELEEFHERLAECMWELARINVSCKQDHTPK